MIPKPWKKGRFLPLSSEGTGAVGPLERLACIEDNREVSDSSLENQFSEQRVGWGPVSKQMNVVAAF